ncbi:MAG TPA: hypothetical protein VFM37_06360 [Pseudonocardiaceae bacterium]|nr:hypothetical protein [Pseudonocardiaceae bacterium]
MDRNIFDEAIGDVPPSSVDVDAIVARQRRAALVRRVGGPAVVAGTAVVAVAFGAALVVPGGLGGNSGGGIAPGAGSSAPAAPSPSELPSSSPRPSGSNPPSGVPNPCALPADLDPIPGDPADVAARLGAALEAAVSQQLPEAQLSTNPINQYNGRLYGPLEFMHVYQEGVDYGNGSCAMHQDYYLARARITDAAGAGNLLAYVGRAEEHGTDLLRCAAGMSPERTFCEERTGPGGEQLIVTTLVVESGAIVHRIDATRPDGTMVTVDSQNVGSDIKEDGPVQRPTPPLTHDQLIAIALTPGLTLFP